MSQVTPEWYQKMIPQNETGENTAHVILRLEHIIIRTLENIIIGTLEHIIIRTLEHIIIGVRKSNVETKDQFQR